MVNTGSTGPPQIYLEDEARRNAGPNPGPVPLPDEDVAVEVPDVPEGNVDYGGFGGVGFVPGQDNSSFIANYITPTEQQGEEWMDFLWETIFPEYLGAAEAYGGYSKELAAGAFVADFTEMLTAADRELFQGKPSSAFGSLALMGARQQRLQPGGLGPITDPGVTPAQRGTNDSYSWFTTDLNGRQVLASYARNWFQMRNPELRNTWQAGTKGPTGGGSGFNASAFRNRFDLDALAARAQLLNRAWLLDEMGNPRDLAKAYVDQMVAGKGEVAIDFDEFVRKRIRDNPRYASIYQNKSESVSEEEHLRPYHEAAKSVLGPTDEAAAAAIGGAQFQSSQDAFGSRLRRTDAVTASSPFINSLEARVRSVKDVFRG